MSEESVFDFYGALGFEETDIEDGLTALACELDAAGGYALMTDDEGAIPATLKQRVIFACYSAEGAFLWSMGFKNSFVFREVWSRPQTPEEKLAAVQEHRASNSYYKG